MSTTFLISIPMKNIIKSSGLLVAAMMMVLSGTITSCNDDDTYDTNQYTGSVKLNVFGPCPVARGGELRFLGNGMDKINKIAIPGCSEITDITKVSSTEIRCQVPQTAEVGYITLYYSGGEITTITPITYSEPISIESLSPMTIKPGQELTINGEYLNLMNQVCFSFIEGGDSVNVNKADFIEHTRAMIKVIVPAEAVSGPVAVSDAAEIPNMVKSEDEITVILPEAETVVDLTDALPGSSHTVKGKDFDLVTSVILTTEELSRANQEIEIEFSYNAEEGSITFVLPEESFDGTIAAVVASGEKVALATIGVVVPTELSANPADGIRAGQEITISGLNMDQVVSVSFPNVEEAVEPASISATAVTVVFPEMAQSGDAVLNLKSGKSVSIALATAKPCDIAFVPAEVSAASQFKIEGKNLDLISTVTFPGDVVVEVAPESSTELVMTAPATASSGSLILTMANGETVETPSLTITAPECAYIVDCLTEEPTAGQLMVFTIANGDKLTEVKVNGTSVQYINNGDQLYVNIPQSAGYGSTITLISSNGEISYTYDITPATHVENAVYDEGPVDMGNWSGNFRIYKDAIRGVPAGAEMIFYVAPYGDYSQLQMNDANWTKIAFLDFGPEDTEVTLTLTSEMLNTGLSVEDGWSETAFVFNGCNCVVNKVVVSYENELGTVVFEGPVDLTWGDDGRFGIAMNYFEVLKAGSTMTFHITQNDNWGQIQINNGCWDNSKMIFPEGVEGYLTTDIIGDKSATEYTLTFTQDVLDNILSNPGDYFGLNTNYQNGDSRVGMVLQGSDIRINKIVFNK